jgi:hypothetical protein
MSNNTPQPEAEPAEAPEKKPMVLPTPEDRVFVSQPYAGFRAMQVCVLPEVPDEEILEVCNRENPQLTTGGWHTVVRSVEHAEECGVDTVTAPGNCRECPPRLHKIVLCM